jgi:plasmid replication initiation protein
MATTVDHHLVVKSNLLVRASYRLNLNEQRLVLLAVAGLSSARPGIKPGLNQVTGIRISAAEFAEAWKIPPKEAYHALKQATNELFHEVITEINGKRTDKMRWVSSVSYHDGEAWAMLSFSPEVTPHLTSIRQKFTEYRLGQVANLRSSYAIRIFEWCMQFDDTGWMQIDLDDLVSRLGLAYTRYVDVRRKVIEPAIAELKAKSNLEIDYAAIKQGRKVIAIKFTFTEAIQGQLDLFSGDAK